MEISDVILLIVVQSRSINFIVTLILDENILSGSGISVIGGYLEVLLDNIGQN